MLRNKLVDAVFNSFFIEKTKKRHKEIKPVEVKVKEPRKKPLPIWRCKVETGTTYIDVMAASKGEARAELKKMLGLDKRERLPAGWKIRRAS